MEKLQGPINSCFLQDELEVGCLEDENGALMGMSYAQFLSNFEESDPHYSLPSLEDKMPFLQMLQGVESQQQQFPFYPLLEETNFQLLLRLQQHQMKPLNEINQHIASGELESCVTNNNDIIFDLHSSQVGGVTSEREVQMSTMVDKVNPKGNFRSNKRTQLGKLSVSSTKEKRKRKRTATRPSKNKEEVESQRMTHIAVERNRRRQMNEHLNALRGLMPPSYVQRGDQASIIGGAIDFVKELEQMLQSLEAQKRMKQSEENCDVSTNSSSSNLFSNMFMTPSSSSSSSSPLQFKYPHSNEERNDSGKVNEELSAENRSAIADIQVMVIQNHVNLKIRCQRRPGQLINVIVALEQLRFTVLHLNITSLHTSVYYSFNLKMEEDCKLGSADEVASAVHQIFRLINSS